VFLYQAEGHTAPRRGRRSETTTNQHFFGELARQIIKVASHLGTWGKLYDIDSRLRPTGTSGPLAVSFAEFERYFAESQARLWERQSLCRARAIFGDELSAARAMNVVQQAAFDRPWRPEDAAAIRDMRRRLEAGAGAGNVKRAPGAALDIEFLVQMMQLRYAGEDRTLRVPNTTAALSALHRAGRLNDEDYEQLNAGYRFFRAVKSRLRLLSLSARNDLPSDGREADKPAKSLGYADGDELLADFRAYAEKTRRRVDELFAAACEEPAVP
jgi:glutamate-ammonia-ligase adenylyltransferase